MHMKEKLLTEFERMEAERNALVASLSRYDAEILTQKPSPEAWNVAEVIMHLVVAENAALTYMRKKLEYGGLQKASATAGLKQRLLNFLIRLPIKYKAPAVANIKQGEEVGYREATERWAEIRNQLRSEYEAMNEQTVAQELFKHPAAGKMSALQGVRFMRQHMNRHIQQIHSAIKKVS